MFNFDRNVLIALYHTLCTAYQNFGLGREQFDDLILKMLFNLYRNIHREFYFLFFSFDLRILKGFCFVLFFHNQYLKFETNFRQLNKNN